MPENPLSAFYDVVLDAAVENGWTIKELRHALAICSEALDNMTPAPSSTVAKRTIQSLSQRPYIESLGSERIPLAIDKRDCVLA